MLRQNVVAELRLYVANQVAGHGHSLTRLARELRILGFGQFAVFESSVEIPHSEVALSDGEVYICHADIPAFYSVQRDHIVVD